MVHHRLGFMRLPRRKPRLVLIAFCVTAIVIAVFSMPCVFRRPTVTRGFLLKTDVDAQGKKYNYVVFVPYDYQPGEKRPLLLFLNGVGENGIDGFKAISKNFGPPVWEMKRGFPFVCAIPQCRPGQSWAGAEEVRAMAVLDRVAQDYGTDPDRAYITGVSAGGDGVWSLVQGYPDRFAAAVPFCGTPGGDVEGLVSQRLPIWNFYNAGDDAGLVEANRSMRQKLLDAGGSPLVTEYPQEGHDCWGRGYQSTGLYTWLLEQSRANNARQHQPFHLFSIEELVAKWQRRGPATWAVGDEQTLSCKGSTGSASCLVSDAAYEEGEIHLEVFFDSEQPECQLKLFASTASGDEEAYTLQAQMAGVGSGGLQDSQGHSLAILDPAAQRQLRADSWNELRLAFNRQHITARINGWKAFDVRVEMLEVARFRVAIVASDQSPRTLWRQVRLRGETGETH